MGQKVHPNSLRVPLIHDWDSNWYIKNRRQFAAYVKEDDVIRTYFKTRLKHASISKVRIERKSEKLTLKVYTGKTGVLIGRGGQGLEVIRKDILELTKRNNVQIDVLEVAKIDLDAQLVSDAIALQLEKRVAYRRAMRLVTQRSLRAGVKGIKIMVSGRLGGTDIARTEWSKEGRIPLHTFRADIDYATTEAKTVFGIIGVKVWIFKGEVLPNQKAQTNIKQRSSRPTAPPARTRSAKPE
jgi:small subunit ribosomal protein S3